MLYLFIFLHSTSFIDYDVKDLSIFNEINIPYNHNIDTVWSTFLSHRVARLIDLSVSHFRGNSLIIYLRLHTIKFQQQFCNVHFFSKFTLQSKVWPIVFSPSTIPLFFLRRTQTKVLSLLE